MATTTPEPAEGERKCMRFLLTFVVTLWEDRWIQPMLTLMRRFPFLLCFVFALLTCTLPLQAEVPEESRKDYQKLIPEMITLLEAKDYSTLLETCVAPEDLKRATEKQTMAELAKGFGERKADQLLGVLKSIREAKPEVTADGSTVTWKLPENVKSPRGQFVMKKSGKFWYIQN